MLVAAIQMVSGTGVAANLDAADLLVAEAAAAGAELVALPENFALMAAHDADRLAAREQFGDGPIQRRLAQAARRHGLWLVGGTLLLHADDPARAFNTTLVFDPDGTCVARYDKIHLFALDHAAERHDEARVVQPGRTPVTFDLPSRDGHRWRVGLSICYDLRFPELYRRLAADLLLVPSAFTHVTGQAHWEVLLRARAIENLAFVAAPAQGGRHDNGRRTWGDTLLVNPWGEVLARRAEGPAVVVAELDAGQLAQCRGRLPALAHRVL